MHSYSLYDVTDFPASASFQTNVQLEHTHTAETTRFQRTGKLDLGFDVYSVEHYTRLKLRGIPYYHGEPIDEVVEKHSFQS